MTIKNTLDTRVNSYINSDCSGLFTFFKGRVALYAILKSMNITESDEVIIPAYTCVVVANTIKYLGAIPRYADIELDTYAAAKKNIASAINQRTKAIICQNTYGLSYNADYVSFLCAKEGLYSIEDCTHGFGGTYHGRPNGSWCDAAFYSSQWNKPFSTGVGGYAIVNDPELSPGVAELAASFPIPSFKTSVMLWTLMKVRSLVNPLTYYAFVAAYRYLSKHNLVTGSSSGQELESIEMPKDYLLGMSGVQKRAAIRVLKRFPAVNALRKANGALYTEYLCKAGLNHVGLKFHEDHLFLKYPLLVRDRERFIALARKAHVSLGDWFRSPLHPVEGDLSKWDFEAKRYPNATFAAAHVVNLPTDTSIPTRVLDFLDANKNMIYDATVDGRLSVRTGGM